MTLNVNFDEKVLIEFNNKQKELIFVLKSKKLSSSFKPCTNPSDILYFLYQDNRWDIICHIVSFCNSYNKIDIVDKLNVDNKMKEMVNDKIEELISKCLNSCVYYKKDWSIKSDTEIDSGSNRINLSNIELNLVIYGYLRYNTNNGSNQYYLIEIPSEIIKLFIIYYGYLSNFIFDVNDNILTASNNNDILLMHNKPNITKSSPFVFYDKYAIYKKGWSLNRKNDIEFMFNLKVLDYSQYFLIGIGIYNEQMSDNLNNGKWIMEKNKYFQKIQWSKNVINDNNNINNKKNKNRNMKWEKDDICSLHVLFCKDFETEYTKNWILNMTLYRNKESLRSLVRCTDDIIDDDHGDDDKYVTKRLHVIICKENQFTESIKLELYNDKITDSIRKAIEWRKYISPHLGPASEVQVLLPNNVLNEINSHDLDYINYNMQYLDSRYRKKMINDHKYGINSSQIKHVDFSNNCVLLELYGIYQWINKHKKNKMERTTNVHIARLLKLYFQFKHNELDIDKINVPFTHQFISIFFV